MIESHGRKSGIIKNAFKKLDKNIYMCYTMYVTQN